MRVKIRVPATSANIGSGFDTMGLALELYNDFLIETLEEREFIFEGIDPQYWEDNLVLDGIRALYDAAGIHSSKIPGLRIVETVNVPIGAGLGSSATCIAAGVLMGNILLGSPFSDDELTHIATQIEGHPDNVVPALTGGLTTSVVTDTNVYTIVKDVPDKYTFCACIPEFALSTKESRTVFSRSYTMSEVVAALSRAVMTYLCLTEGRSELLQETFGDVLHEPYRKHNIPGYDAIVRAGKDFGSLIAYLSGSGPTIMFVLDDERADVNVFIKNMARWLKAHYPEWKILPLKASRAGSQVKQ